jgi:methionine sulfoxide reductase catalytic subunit
MLMRRRRGWELPERQATDEAIYWRRRDLAKGIAAGSILLALPACNSESVAEKPGLAAGLYPAKRNGRYELDR